MKKINSFFTSFIEFFKGAGFLKALLLTVAIVVPIVIAVHYGRLNLGIAMAIGVILSSPSDVAGGFRRRITGILISIGIAVFATIITSYSAKNLWIFVPVLAVLTFSFSFISIYGFRASLIAFSGLFAVVLSMANVSSETSILFHAFLIGCGGMFYLGLTFILNYFYKGRQTEDLLIEIFELTSDFLRLRGELITSSTPVQEELNKKLAQLQIDLNEKHETFRELVISRSLNSGRSSGNRKKLLIFMELVDILELGMANPVDYKKTKVVFTGNEDKLHQLQEWSISLASQLKKLGYSLKKGVPNSIGTHLEDELKQMKHAVSGFKDDDEALPIYHNFLHFKERQFRKILSIERILGNLGNFRKIKIKNQEAAKFITHQEYSLKKLQDNLDLKSPILRHSLRLTVIILVGFAIGKFLEVQNAYWILLTSLVILRPGYALTKERFKQRLYGTLIGGAVATSIIFLTHNLVIHAILAIITFVLGFAMIQRNYKTAAAFITLNVVFIYSLLTPNAYQVIQFRLLDTVIGAGLAFLGNSFLWPTWEYKGIKNFIATSIRANQEYLKEINVIYKEKGKFPTPYKLSRKEAFLASGNLSAAFQRITQEPTAKDDVGKIYEIVTLNQELLASIASLGTFIRTHKTTSASVHFKNYSKSIQENLSHSLHALEGKSYSGTISSERIAEAQSYFRSKLEELSPKKGNESEKERFLIEYQEARLITDQLKWLLEISSDLRNLILQYSWK